MSIKSERRRKAKLRLLKKQGHVEQEQPAVHETKHKRPRRKGVNGVLDFYDRNYKILLIIPFVLLLLAICQVGYQAYTTGDFVSKGVSLKGGITVTLPDTKVDVFELEEHMLSVYPQNDISVRKRTEAGQQVGVIIDADIADKDKIPGFVESISEKTGELTEDDYSVEFIGSSLGESFFKQTFKALIMAFLFMGMVVFFYFGTNTLAKVAVVSLSIINAAIVYYTDSILTSALAIFIGVVLIGLFLKYSIPSIAVILAALSDMIITLAIVNMLGIKLSTAGIAAFLMLIGYSVDTDILLSTRVLRRKEGTVFNGVMDAMKTGLTMSVTTTTAVIVALVFARSDILIQIMTILLIGLLIDVINTWIQNAGILRWHLEGKKDE